MDDFSTRTFTKALLANQSNPMLEYEIFQQGQEKIQQAYDQARKDWTFEKPDVNLPFVWDPKTAAQKKKLKKQADQAISEIQQSASFQESCLEGLKDANQFDSLQSAINKIAGQGAIPVTCMLAAQKFPQKGVEGSILTAEKLYGNQFLNAIMPPQTFYAQGSDGTFFIKQSFALYKTLYSATGLPRFVATFTLENKTETPQTITLDFFLSYKNTAVGVYVKEGEWTAIYQYHNTNALTANGFPTAAPDYEIAPDSKATFLVVSETYAFQESHSGRDNPFDDSTTSGTVYNDFYILVAQLGIKGLRNAYQQLGMD